MQYTNCAQWSHTLILLRHISPYKIMKLRTDEQNVMRKETYLCTSENNLARHKNEQYNLGLLHSIDQSWKQLRFILQTTTDSQE
jgi:hypothetical protein